MMRNKISWNEHIVRFNCHRQMRCCVREVADETTAYGLWLKLESLYMTKFLTNQLYLIQCSYTLCKSEGTSVKSHIDELNRIVDVAEASRKQIHTEEW